MMMVQEVDAEKKRISGVRSVRGRRLGLQVAAGKEKNKADQRRQKGAGPEAGAQVAAGKEDKFDFGIPSPRGMMMMTMMMQEVDAGGGCRRWIQEMDAGGAGGVQVDPPRLVASLGDRRREIRP